VPPEVKTLWAIPLPRGNQPTAPTSSPVADLAAALLPGACPVGAGRRPRAACPLGRRGLCAWSVHSPEDHFCLFPLLERRDDLELVEIADYLGISRARLRQVTEAFHGSPDRVRVFRPLA